MKKNMFWLILMGCLVFFFRSIQTSQASSKTTVEVTVQSGVLLNSEDSSTHQSDSFNGTYTSETRSSSELSKNHETKLLQTNDTYSWMISLSGVCLVIITLYRWKKKNKLLT